MSVTRYTSKVKERRENILRFILPSYLVIAHIWDIIRANGATRPREMPRTVDGGAYKHRACEVRGVSCVMCILCVLYTALYRTLPRILYTDDREQRSHTNTKHRACTVHRTDGTSCQSFDWELYHGVSP